jgi:hypothetical protein
LLPQLSQLQLLLLLLLLVVLQGFPPGHDSPGAV